MRFATPRSMLFVSGEKPERFPKALAAGADLVCIDLEDAVAPALKSQARSDVLGFLAQLPAERPCGVALRINAVSTREGLADVTALLESGLQLDMLVVPKVEAPQELALLHAWLGEQIGGMAAIVETPLGIEQAPALASLAHTRAPTLQALMLGGADLSVELGAEFGWDGLLSARGRLVNAARTAGLQCWDVPHLDLSDLPDLALETRRVAAMGFGCKAAIHPSQVPVIHEALRPPAAEVAWARQLMEAVEARGPAPGAFLFQGRMVDAPVLAKARRTLQRASNL